MLPEIFRAREKKSLKNHPQIWFHYKRQRNEKIPRFSLLIFCMAAGWRHFCVAHPSNFPSTTFAFKNKRTKEETN